MRSSRGSVTGYIGSRTTRENSQRRDIAKMARIGVGIHIAEGQFWATAMFCDR
jgi:hypothetical protein